MYSLEEAINYFGLTGTATKLHGEYDDNFHIKADDGKEYLLKISQPNENKTIVEMQNAALQHLQQATLTFQTPKLLGYNDAKLARLFDFIPGTLFGDMASHSSELLENLGVQLGHLSYSLSQFQHKDAKRYLKWDLKQALWIREHLHELEDPKLIQDILQKFESHTLPVLANLRQSVIHGDVNDYNILVTDNRVTGFIDFGDMVETATICELAIALTYAMLDKEDPLAAADQIIKGYHKTFPLQAQEIDILFDLVKIRLSISIVNAVLRKFPEIEKSGWALLRKLHKTEIQKDRNKYFSKNLGLSYDKPLQIVKGRGQYLYDENGRQYLDCVNNVCHVGHCHPKVVAAGQQQMALLNTNTRYLHANLTRYAKRLLATLPQPLEVCFFVCSGSEANELALRLARTYTNRKDVLVLDHGYHGNTTTLVDISPYKFNSPGGKGKPEFVHVLPMFDLPEIKHALSAFICESLPSCAGQVVLPPQYLQRVYAAVRSLGGVCIADEVQVGLGRVGTHFWGFETQDVIPDIVTMGKPLGNGHPIGAVITTRAIADAFCNGMEYFNTFGGNPVSCAIGLSVLEVIEEENLQAHALKTGNYLKQQLNELKAKHAIIKEVRGLGLFLGIEFAASKAKASLIVNQLKERGILLGTDGPNQNVLKIKPPLVFSKSDCDFLANTLKDVLLKA